MSSKRPSTSISCEPLSRFSIHPSVAPRANQSIWKRDQRLTIAPKKPNITEERLFQRGEVVEFKDWLAKVPLAREIYEQVMREKEAREEGEGNQ